MSESRPSRNSKVCTNCKARKVKCDRQTPCQNCIRRGCEDACQTSTPSVSSQDSFHVFSSTPARKRKKYHTKIAPKVVRRKIIKDSTKFDYTGVNLFVDKDESLNLYTTPTTVSLSKDDTPMSCFTLIKKDTGLSYVYEYEEYLKQSASAMRNGGVRIKGSNTMTQESFMKQMDAMTARPVYNSGNSEEIQSLSERIIDVLPNRSIISSTVRQFMDHVACFIPYIDPPPYLERLEKIIGPLNSKDEKITKLNLSDDCDLCFIAIALIMIRLGYLSMISYTNNFTTLEVPDFGEGLSGSTIDWLLKNQISLRLITIAEECFKQFSLITNPSLDLIQLALFFKMYQHLAPEFGDCLYGGNAQLLTGVIVQLSVSAGLNRDPDYTDFASMSSKEKNLRRRLWYSLMFRDISEAFMFGSSVSCDLRFFDTKAPEIPSDGVLRCRVYDHLDKVVKKLRDVMGLVLDMRGVKMMDVANKVGDAEKYVLKEFGTLNSNLFYDRQHLDKERISRIRVLLSIQVFYVTFFFNMYLHYEKKGIEFRDFAFFYQRKTLSISVLQVMPYVLLIITKSQTLLGNSADLMIIPDLLQVISRMILHLFSLYTRLKFAKYSWSKQSSTLTDKTTQDTVSSLIGLLERILQTQHVALRTLAPRYYFAFKNLHLYETTWKISNDENFYQSYFLGGVLLRDPPFTGDQLKELHEICELGLQTLQEQHSTQTHMTLSPDSFPFPSNPSEATQPSSASDISFSPKPASLVTPQESDPVNLAINLDDELVKALDDYNLDEIPWINLNTDTLDAFDLLYSNHIR